jgi:hypothetical protein
MSQLNPRHVRNPRSLSFRSNQPVCLLLNVIVIFLWRHQNCFVRQAEVFRIYRTDALELCWAVSEAM